MGKQTTRQLASFKVRARKGRAYEVRGTYKGFRLDANTGERDEAAATRKAAKMWADHVRFLGFDVRLRSGFEFVDPEIRNGDD